MGDPFDAAAAAGHAEYEALAEQFGYNTRQATKAPWEHLPESHRALMTAAYQAGIDAWLRATVAHQPCNGTGEVVIGQYADEHETGHMGMVDQYGECPGPHTQITISEPVGAFGTDEIMDVLFADPDRIHQWTDPNEWALTLPLPPGWTPQ